MEASGVDTLDAVQLGQLLNGKVVNVRTGITERTQVISGATARGDLETALQLLYLRLTRPRMDTLVYHNLIARSRETLANRGANPDAVFADTVNAVLGNYSYRSSPPGAAHLQRVDLQKAYRIYRDRFADASGFTFVFVGNFNIDSLIPLSDSYLGSLPALHRGEQARDLKDHIPAGEWTKKVYRGKGPEQEDVDKFKAAYLKQLEPLYRQNGYWLSYLAGVYQNGEDPLVIKGVQQRLDSITVASLKDAAPQYLGGGNWISFELLPAQ